MSIEQVIICFFVLFVDLSGYSVLYPKIAIHYNCVGVIEIPDLIPLPAPEVSVNTRKGVVVNYAPSTIAG